MKVESKTFDMSDNDNFSYYLETLDIKTNQDTLVLTSQYYYDLHEIKHITTLIHTKELNKVRDLQKLMSNMMSGLTHNNKLIGCFIDNNIHYSGRFVHWISHLSDLSDMSDVNYLSRKKVIKLFTKYGFKILDMTELNGKTYFCINKQ
jgi:hypothetical protein